MLAPDAGKFWIGDAKREETRKRRIAEAKQQLGRGVKALMK